MMYWCTLHFYRCESLISLNIHAWFLAELRSSEKLCWVESLLVDSDCILVSREKYQ